MYFVRRPPPPRPSRVTPLEDVDGQGHPARRRTLPKRSRFLPVGRCGPHHLRDSGTASSPRDKMLSPRSPAPLAAAARPARAEVPAPPLTPLIPPAAPILPRPQPCRRHAGAPSRLEAPNGQPRAHPTALLHTSSPTMALPRANELTDAGHHLRALVQQVHGRDHGLLRLSAPTWTGSGDMDARCG